MPGIDMEAAHIRKIGTLILITKPPSYESDQQMLMS